QFQLDRKTHCLAPYYLLRDRIGFGERRPAARLSENPFHVGDDDEIVVPLADAADEVGAPMHADPWRLLGRGGGDLGHLVYLVGEDADRGGIAVEVDLDDDHPRILR